MAGPAEQNPPEIERRLIDPARRAADALASIWEPAELPSGSFPGYALIREVHRGAQGVVYQATQKNTNRSVAIKVMREGPFAGARDKVRFEREVQILGRLVHPNIVTIHDSGVASGSFFFVMDYVAGQTLDDYGVEHGQTIRAVLQLFAKICEAVHAAHLRGVIHRDLKPSNIRIDAGGEPRILDFGLAKEVHPTQQKDGAASLTTTGQFVGSLPWASPEQAAGNSDAIDVRSDVYSLGVILYRLLTGQFPYPVAGQVRDVLTHILATDPRRPRAVKANIDDEVETILLKCLSKVPTRRYQSAGELARDIRHYLAGEPIEAKRDSGWYLLRKGMQRYRAATAVTAVILVLIGASFATLSIMYGTVLRERDRAVDAESAAATHLIEVEKARDESEAVTMFLTNMVSAVEPGRQGKDVMMREILDNASTQIDEDFAHQPLIRGRLRYTLGVTYFELGLYDQARAHLVEAVAIFRRERGERHPQTLAAMNGLAGTFRASGGYSASEAMLRGSWEVSRRTMGDDHLETLRHMNSLANAVAQQGRYVEAEQLQRSKLEIVERVLGSHHLETIKSRNNLAGMLHGQGRYGEAETLYRETLDRQRQTLGEEHPETLALTHNLAATIEAQGRYNEAEALYRAVLDVRCRVLGEEHPSTIRTVNNLASSLTMQGLHEESEALRRKALAANRRVLGEKHPETLLSLHNLAFGLASQGRFAEAEPMYRESLAEQTRVLGEDHPHVLHSMGNLAEMLEIRGAYAESTDLYRRALEIRRTTTGTNHPETLWVMTKLAGLTARDGKDQESETLYREAGAIYRARIESANATASDFAAYASLQMTTELPALRDPDAALSAARRAVEMTGGSNAAMLTTLADAQRLAGQLDLAIESQRQALSILPAAQSPTRADFESRLGELLVERQSHAEAEPLLLESFGWMKEHCDSFPDACDDFLRRIVKLYESWDAAERGKGYAERAAEYRNFLDKRGSDGFDEVPGD